MKNDNEKYCTECGELINIKAEICPKCGVRQESAAKSAPPADNSRWIVALLLCWFLGVFGIHRFYTGHIAIGVVQLLTFGACGIWTLVDFIILVSGNFRDADGNPVKNG